MKISKYYFFAESLFEYVFSGAGPMTLKAGMETVAFVNTKYSNSSIEYPDLQITLQVSLYNSVGNLSSSTSDGFSTEPAFNLTNAYTVVPGPTRPRSRGKLILIKKLKWSVFTFHEKMSWFRAVFLCSIILW